MMGVIALDNLIIEYDDNFPTLSLLIRKRTLDTCYDVSNLFRHNEIMWNIVKKNMIGKGNNTCVMSVVVKTEIGKNIFIDFINQKAEFVDDNFEPIKDNKTSEKGV